MGELDTIIHQPVRLKIMAALKALPPGEMLEFVRLKALVEATEGNLGVQMMRSSKDGITEFITISYWARRADIEKYAGTDIEKPHHLPRDEEYLFELPEFVKNCELTTNDLK